MLRRIIFVRIILTIRRTEMIIARIYYPVTTLGYGKRVGIWVAGCNNNCKNCMSDTLKSMDAGVMMTIDEILKIIDGINMEIDGFTISGGEPFLQIEELKELTKRLSQSYTDDIIVYTGYTMEWLKKKYPEAIKKITEKVSVIIDGGYIEELNDGIGIKGSSNQKIHIFRNHRRHSNLFSAERKVQLVKHKKGITVIGIP